jgi:hypothetical protein
MCRSFWALDATIGERLQSIHSAVERILESPKGNTLAGLRIKDLIQEGHQY